MYRQREDARCLLCVYVRVRVCVFPGFVLVSFCSWFVVYLLWFGFLLLLLVEARNRETPPLALRNHCFPVGCCRVLVTFVGVRCTCRLGCFVLVYDRSPWYVFA